MWNLLAPKRVLGWYVVDNGWLLIMIAKVGTCKHGSLEEP